MPTQRNESSIRFNAYLSPYVRKCLEEYSSENCISMSSAINVILKQYFDGQALVKDTSGINQILQSLKNMFPLSSLENGFGFIDNKVES